MQVCIDRGVGGVWGLVLVGVLVAVLGWRLWWVKREVSGKCVLDGKSS